MDRIWIKAGQVVLNDRINSGLRPNQIRQAQAAWGFNLGIRNSKHGVKLGTKHLNR